MKQPFLNYPVQLEHCLLQYNGYLSPEHLSQGKYLNLNRIINENPCCYLQCTVVYNDERIILLYYNSLGLYGLRSPISGDISNQCSCFEKSFYNSFKQLSRILHNKQTLGYFRILYHVMQSLQKSGTTLTAILSTFASKTFKQIGQHGQPLLPLTLSKVGYNKGVILKVALKMERLISRAGFASQGLKLR